MYRNQEQQMSYQRLWMQRRRSEWFSKNGPCVDCGSSERMELDHDDRKTKVTHKVWSWRQERREAELAKCVVRCHECHLVKTKAERATWSTKPIPGKVPKQPKVARPMSSGEVQRLVRLRVWGNENGAGK